MLDYKVEIREFIQKFYSPAPTYIEVAIQYNSKELLALLFAVFPEGCIDEYELYEILKGLNFEIHKTADNTFHYCLFPIS